ncbi:MAG TPA: universal stress protein [Candidatus Corynebacterium gallistercoris]|uniref:Universal stress protein n=1 Tax=Candidatus Corynebacterium gallistercoris TaxID=2838530 RepID=A0A9D1UQS4_9CORY|nr:universal stress protein [Candidatus Corynebacterium gallistercoris]
MYNTIVVGTDGSESSLLAVQRASDLAAAVGAELVLASAFIGPEGDRATVQARTTTVEGKQAAEAALSGAEAVAKDKGVATVRTVVREGSPVDALMGIVNSEEADLLIVGNRGINSLTGRLLGSVPADVARQAHCDVMIVHTVD